MPQVGDIEDGYRFKGGDPSNQASWEQVAPKAAPAWGAGALEYPDGSIRRVGPKGGLTVLRKATVAETNSGPLELTEDQGKAQTYASLMTGAERAYRRAVAEGYDPGSLRNTAASVAEGLPLGGLDGVGAALRDDVGDRARQAELMWSDAQLKAMSGAASPEAEVKRNVRTYFPRPGETFHDIDPQKRAARAIAFGAAKTRAGPAGPSVGSYPRDDIPAAARRASDAFKRDARAPFGSQGNPYVAKDEATLHALPPGSFAFAPNGDLVRVD